MGRFAVKNLAWLIGSTDTLPVADGSFDRTVAARAKSIPPPQRRITTGCPHAITLKAGLETQVSSSRTARILRSRKLDRANGEANRT
jgi:hypothetical protein